MLSLMGHVPQPQDVFLPSLSAKRSSFHSVRQCVNGECLLERAKARDGQAGSQGLNDSPPNNAMNEIRLTSSAQLSFLLGNDINRCSLYIFTMNEKTKNEGTRRTIL
jgi:hypothetical protein